MARIVVIDSLSRSGTTLITSVIHSQENAACYRGVFHELLACDIGTWAHDYAIHPLIKRQVKYTLSKSKWTKSRLANLFKSRVLNRLNKKNKQYTFEYAALASNSLRTLEKRKQYDKLRKSEWEDFLLSNTPQSFKQLDELYQNLAKAMSCKVLTFRWNQGLAYIHHWLRNPNHYWISVVRNPMDRALSSFKAFNQNYEDSLACTKAYSEKLNEVMHAKNHYLIYYEDLISNPEVEIRKLFQFLGMGDIEINYNLIQQSGAAYKVETSDLIDEGKKHTEGKEYTGFDKSMANKYKTNLHQDVIDKFLAIIEDSPVLQRYKLNDIALTETV